MIVWFEMSVFSVRFSASCLMVFNPSCLECLTKSERQNRCKWQLDNCWMFCHRFSFWNKASTQIRTTCLMFSAKSCSLASTWSMDNIFWFLNQQLRISRWDLFMETLQVSCQSHVIMWSCFFWKQGWLTVLNDIDFDNVCGTLAFHLRTNKDGKVVLIKRYPAQLRENESRWQLQS